MSQPRSRWHVMVTITVLLLVCAIGVSRSARAGSEDKHRNPVVDNATQKVLQGEQIFRFDIFGDQAFWGDTLKLHQAIEGAKFGGVGPGVSPKTALIPKSEIGGFTNHPWMQKLRSGAEGPRESERYVR